MTTKTIALEDLENALRYWEDLNLYGELVFQIYHSGKLKDDKIYKNLSAVPGSDVTSLGYIGRAINSYSKLRSALSAIETNDETSFMPRMPKSLRGVIDYESWIESTSEISGNVRIPYYLQSWSKTKKVCQITEENLIPSVNLKEENHLGKLPYSCFVLSLTDEILLKYTSDVYFSTFIVKQKGDYLQIFSIPKITEENLISEKNRKKIKAVLGKKNKTAEMIKLKSIVIDEGFSSLIDFFQDEFRISDGRIISRYVDGSLGSTNQTFSDIYSEWGDLFDMESVSIYAFTKNIIEMVNGFCKLMSELPPGESIHRTKEYEEYPDQDEHSLLGWNEVPIGEVKYLSVENDGLDIVRIHTQDYTSSEKSYHERRGHWRRIVKRNGELDTIWINKMDIRLDKKEDGVQGSATVFK